MPVKSLDWDAFPCWKKASVGPAAGQGASTASAPADSSRLGAAGSETGGARAENAELVALGITENNPRLVALSYVNSCRAER